jgi:hypothetical protein
MSKSALKPNCRKGCHSKCMPIYTRVVPDEFKPCSPSERVASDVVHTV